MYPIGCPPSSSSSTSSTTTTTPNLGKAATTRASSRPQSTAAAATTTTTDTSTSNATTDVRPIATLCKACFQDCGWTGSVKQCPENDICLKDLSQTEYYVSAIPWELVKVELKSGVYYSSVLPSFFPGSGMLGSLPIVDKDGNAAGSTFGILTRQETRTSTNSAKSASGNDDADGENGDDDDGEDDQGSEDDGTEGKDPADDNVSSTSMTVPTASTVSSMVVPSSTLSASSSTDPSASATQNIPKGTAAPHLPSSIVA
ncbi:hypothetical protein FRC04_003831 [Tulasnella sp. 424]|nr:hypothetical protein FRC04_003831 [Tulasnella sp. 424]